MPLQQSATPTRTLSERASKDLLADYGVPVPAERIARDASEAATAACELGFPVVAKLCGDHIAHKTERGLVRLGLGTSEAVAEAAADLLARATVEDGDVAVLVAPMVSGSRELIVGMQRDPQFGPTVLVGIGGILAEAVADVAIGLAPLTDIDALEMIESLTHQALLGPFRGEPGVDLDALADVIRGLSGLALDRPEVISVDVNPLIISDGRPVAVDALVEVAS